MEYRGFLSSTASIARRTELDVEYEVFEIGRDKDRNKTAPFGKRIAMAFDNI